MVFYCLPRGPTEFKYFLSFLIYYSLIFSHVFILVSLPTVRRFHLCHHVNTLREYDNRCVTIAMFELATLFGKGKVFLLGTILQEIQFQTMTSGATI